MTFRRFHRMVFGIVLAITVTACSGPEEKAMKFFEKGKALYEGGDYIKARLEFKNTLQIDPNFARGYYMLGMVEMRPLGAVHLPPRVEDEIQPLASLTGMQQKLWDRIREHLEDFSARVGRPCLTSKPFRLDDLGDDYSVIEVQRTLDLFERMGVIVKVAYEGSPYYRLTADRDLVRQESES